MPTWWSGYTTDSKSVGLVPYASSSLAVGTIDFLCIVI